MAKPVDPEAPDVEGSDVLDALADITEQDVLEMRFAVKTHGSTDLQDMLETEVDDG